MRNCNKRYLLHFAVVAVCILSHITFCKTAISANCTDCNNKEVWLNIDFLFKNISVVQNFHARSVERSNALSGI